MQLVLEKECKIDFYATHLNKKMQKFSNSQQKYLFRYLSLEKQYTNIFYTMYNSL